MLNRAEKTVIVTLSIFAVTVFIFSLLFGDVDWLITTVGSIVGGACFALYDALR